MLAGHFLFSFCLLLRMTKCFCRFNLTNYFTTFDNLFACVSDGSCSCDSQVLTVVSGVRKERYTMVLSKTIALVTGGCSGLGASTVKRLVQNGAKVLIADLPNQEEFFKSSVAKDLESTAGEYVFCPTDVTSTDQVNAAFDKVEESFGSQVNAVVNCAGIGVAQKTLSKNGVHPADSFAKVLEVNTVGSFRVASLGAERMANREPDADTNLRGCIINTASIAAFEGQVGQVAYATSKGGVVGMTLPMARDLSPLGIRVMTIVSSTWFFQSDGLSML